MSYEKALELIEIEKEKETGILYLSNKKLMEIPEQLKKLTHLHTLTLGYNSISHTRVLENLINLTSLNLRNNQINHISRLTKLSKLTNLNLRDNRINDISILEKLPGLKVLILSSNYIYNINSLENLSNLTILNLHNNHIKDINALEKLTNIEVLYLGHNQISDIRVLANLSNLRELYLGSNQISDISVLEKLPKLTTLYLGGNKIDTLFALEKLINLKTLCLNSNQINSLDSLLPLIRNGILVSLEESDYENKINLYDNPITTPTLAIVQQGNAAILRYFAEKERGSQKLMEAKLLIVGQGGAGKTSLKRKLHNVNEKMPEPEDTTRGIDVTQLDCKTNNGEDFRLNIWDFGGQNVQHYAHQFFLTGSSLYALVTNEREQNPNFQYWLNIIEMLGGKSPVLIVQNEIAGHSEPIKNAAAIRERFENVKEFLAVDLSKASSDKRFSDLHKQIINQALRLPHVGKEYPTSYVRVREALEQKTLAGKHYISWAAYQDLCRTAQVDDLDVMQDIATTFTILGVCLHFKDDAVLRKFVFLNPKWIIDALFELLYHPLVVAQQGQFSENDLARIWSHELYADMDDKLIRIMENFELCYLIKDSRNYIVPQRLPAEQQSYGWHEPQATRVEYEYKFMPKGIITRLTCRLHEKIEGNNVWNDAVIFSQDKARAFAREVYAENKIAIEVSGDKRADLLNRILDEVDDIHRKSNYENLQVEKKVPCSCRICDASDKKHFYKYEVLLRRFDKNPNRTTSCEISDEEIPIRDLLVHSGIDFKKDRRMGRWENSGELEMEGIENQAILLQKKLNHLKQELIVCNDSAQKFTLQERIQETEKSLKAIREE